MLALWVQHEPLCRLTAFFPLTVRLCHAWTVNQQWISRPVLRLLLLRHSKLERNLEGKQVDDAEFRQQLQARLHY